ncbi:hypothetical protein TGMAS_417670, partial [Toxoplasma gondii MAS]
GKNDMHLHNDRSTWSMCAGLYYMVADRYSKKCIYSCASTCVHARERKELREGADVSLVDRGLQRRLFASSCTPALLDATATSVFSFLGLLALSTCMETQLALETHRGGSVFLLSKGGRNHSSFCQQGLFVERRHSAVPERPHLKVCLA